MDNSIINKIKNELNIVDIISEYVDLSKKGKNYWGICPFHEDSNPSMSVSFDKQLFKCFVCQAGGDLIKFTSQINNVSFPKALSILAKKIGIEYNITPNLKNKYSKQQEKLISIHKDAMTFFQYSLSTQLGQKAHSYIIDRGLNNSLIETFSIGYAPKSGLKEYLLKKGHDEADIINSSLENNNGHDFFKDRLIFGIKNIYGDIVSFSARDLSGNSNAKYINSAETPLFNKSNILYNYFDALEASKKEKQVFINEGFMDVIAMYRAGIRNSVAIMGTALTENHVKLLKNFSVNLMLDGDKAGISATIKSIKILLKYNIKTFVIQNKDNYDPDEIISKYGIEKLISVSKNKIEALEFIFQLHQKKYSNITPNTALDFTKSFAAYLTYASDLQKDFYINKLSQTLNISRDIIQDNIKISKKNQIEVAVLNNTKTKVKKIKNNTYKLIKSMVNNHKLINIFKENKPYLIEPILVTITNYIIEANEKKNIEKPSEEMKIKFQEINSYNDFVNSPEEFKELIQRVNIESYEWEIDSNNVKLKGTIDQNKKTKILEDNIKLMRELRKNGDK